MPTEPNPRIARAYAAQRYAEDEEIRVAERAAILEMVRERWAALDNKRNELLASRSRPFWKQQVDILNAVMAELEHLNSDIKARGATEEE